MNFLEKYGFVKEDIDEFMNNTPKKMIDELEKHSQLVETNCDQQQKEYGSIPLCRHIGWVFYPSAGAVSMAPAPLISSPGMVPRGCYK